MDKSKFMMKYSSAHGRIGTIKGALTMLEKYEEFVHKGKAFEICTEELELLVEDLRAICLEVFE